MKIILITGMSATGKSSAIADLLSRGFSATDLDNEDYSTWIDAPLDPLYPDNEVKPGKDWVWQESRVADLLTTCNTELLFVSGCASNMSKFYPLFDHIVLLTASANVIADRLHLRPDEGYGKTPDEVARVLRLKLFIEPLLRDIADLEIDTGIHPISTTELILQPLG